MAKIKFEYHALTHGNNKTGGAPQDDGKHPIHGGGLEEWKVQNAKIINNGMIMAEEDRHGPYGCSDQSRASPTERATTTGPDVHLAEKTPRSIPTMFTAINNTPTGACHELHTSAALPNSDGPPGQDYTRAGNMLQAGQLSPPAFHHSVSGSHDLDVISEARVRDILSESESMRIAEALEGLGAADIQGFSYGDPDVMLFGQTLPGLTFGAAGKWQLAEEAETG